MSRRCRTLGSTIVSKIGLFTDTNEQIRTRLELTPRPKVIYAEALESPVLKRHVGGIFRHPEGMKYAERGTQSRLRHRVA